MYNLLVSNSDQTWNGTPWTIELGRCVREYTDQSITSKYGDLTADQVRELRRFPCIFAFEAAWKKDPLFGVISDVVSRQGEVRLEYEIIPITPFISAADFEKMAFALDISKWEMNRTHWAVKDVDLAKELHVYGISLPQWARTSSKAVDVTKHEFQVALSFPGEIREYVESVARELERLVGPNSYFYDNNYVSQLARPGLDLLLQDIYGSRSKLVAVFLCTDYQNKEWCGAEFRVIREIIMKRQHERVMFIKMDDGNVEGVFKTDGYIDGRRFQPSEVAGFIQERISFIQ